MQKRRGETCSARSNRVGYQAVTQTATRKKPMSSFPEAVVVVNCRQLDAAVVLLNLLLLGVQERSELVLGHGLTLVREGHRHHGGQQERTAGCGCRTPPTPSPSTQPPRPKSDLSRTATVKRRSLAKKRPTPTIATRQLPTVQQAKSRCLLLKVDQCSYQFNHFRVQKNRWASLNRQTKIGTGILWCCVSQP